jgi:hypothetical protein
MPRRLAVPFVAVLLLAGCETVVKRTLPDTVHTVFIDTFQTLGDQSLLPAVVGDELRRSFRLDGRLGVADHAAGAQAVLGGTFSVYDKVPSRYDRNNIVQEYRLLIGADLTLTDPATGLSLWQNAGTSATALSAGASPGAVTPAVAATVKTAPRRITQDVVYTVVPASGLPVESEEDAQRRAIRELAERIVHKVVEGW